MCAFRHTALLTRVHSTPSSNTFELCSRLTSEMRHPSTASNGIRPTPATGPADKRPRPTPWSWLSHTHRAAAAAAVKLMSSVSVSFRSARAEVNVNETSYRPRRQYMQGVHLPPSQFYSTWYLVSGKRARCSK